MSTSQSKAVSALNDLVEICEDGYKGFTSAAESVKDPLLKSLFKEYAHERGSFAHELQQEIRGLGEEPEDRGTAAGAVHRGWIGLKSTLTGHDEHAIVAECERGEDAAKAAYEKALEGLDLPGTILPMVEKQYQQVKKAHDRVKDIRDGATVGSHR